MESVLMRGGDGLNVFVRLHSEVAPLYEYLLCRVYRS